MKRCPECRRDYFDDTLVYCLDDGGRLVDGPSIAEAVTLPFGKNPDHEATTKELPAARPSDASVEYSHSAGDRRLRMPSLRLVLGLAAVATLAAVYYFTQNGDRAEKTPAASQPQKLYWDMAADEQDAFIVDRARHVQTLIGGGAEDLDAEAIATIKKSIDRYAERRASLSQEPFDEGLRTIFGRATQFAPVVTRSFEANKVPPVIGVYQAMIESEYHDCLDLDGLVDGKPPVGLFQFSRRTAAIYGLKPEDYCDVVKQSDAAARHMSDLVSDFGNDGSAWTLALLSFNLGPNGVREQLRKLRAKGVMQRSFWTIFRHRNELKEELDDESSRYVPRFFAAAIIGETPAAFDLPTPPLSTVNR